MTIRKIAIVTDSTADVPDDIADMLNIHIVNNIIMIDGKSFEDRVEISRQDFYKNLPEMTSFPTTATASSGVYQVLYEKLFKLGAEYILSIHASSKLSGIFNAASLAAKSFGKHVQVFDSGNISLGLGFQVIAAAEAASQGLSFENIINQISELRNRVRVVALLDTLEYVRRSGRVGWIRARIGDMLHIKPLLEIRNGMVFSLGETRTFNKGINRLCDMLNSFIPLERLAILHTNAEDKAANFLKRIQIHFSGLPLIVNVTTVIGSHVGPNGLGFVAIQKENF